MSLYVCMCMRTNTDIEALILKGYMYSVMDRQVSREQHLTEHRQGHEEVRRLVCVLGQQVQQSQHAQLEVRDGFTCGCTTGRAVGGRLSQSCCEGRGYGKHRFVVHVWRLTLIVRLLHQGSCCMLVTPT